MTTTQSTLGNLTGWRDGWSLPTEDHERIPNIEDLAVADRLYRDAVAKSNRTGITHALKIQLVIERRRVAHIEKLLAGEAGT